MRKKSRRGRQFHCEDFSPHGHSSVRLLVCFFGGFFGTARQCKSICSLVVGFCRLFACIIATMAITQLSKNSTVKSLLVEN